MGHRCRAFAATVVFTVTLLGFTSAAQARDDVLVWGQGDSSGYHLFTGVSSERWAWRPLATLRPVDSAGEPWIGYQCLTGDGRHVVAVVAPRGAANNPVARDRGAFAYAVEVASGRVHPLASGVALKYHTPGCGIGARATVSRNLGTDQARTQLLLVNAHRGKVMRTVTVRGQVTSAVPVGGQIWAARGRAIVRVDRRGVHRVARTAGQPFSLRPSSPGVDYLVAQRARVLVRSVARGKVRRLGSGRLGATKLFLGRRGRSVLVGGRPATRALRAVRPPRSGVVRSASLGGGVVLSQRSRVAPRLSSPRGGPSRAAAVGAARRRAFTRLPAFVGLPRARAANFTTPKCAVPRNDLRRQVPQPNAAQIDWAIQQATRNNLKGAVLTRPANYLNMGLASYQPSSDFVRRDLTGSPGTPVPPAVISAVYAQESAWRHASFRALPGVSGNPLVSDYYGANGTLDRIEYDAADCGYGVSQVTDPMSAASTAYSANGKTKVAVDYAENVAAGIQFLVDKWNQLAAAGVKLNDGNPAMVENWYFAVWAYNTGFHPPAGGAPWGLGWTNNPINADYPPDRQPFLRSTYADAEHPADWPYQERIFGWIETPMLDYKGHAAYKAVGPLTGPGITRFCTTSNQCSPSYHNPSDPSLDFCQRADRQCWWHDPVTWLNCAADCHNSTFTVAATAPEPAPDNNYAPECGSILAGTAIIVDEQPSNLNVEGCGAAGWTSQGTFSVTNGTAASGAPLGVIDWHQLGTGFGGHIWFTKNQPAGDTAHINTGTWTPPALNGIYNIKAHVPPSGASTSYARYRIYRGDGTVSEKVINQHLHENRWVSLGNYTLQAGAKVVLDNVTGEADESTNVAFDALAFTKVAGTPVRRTVETVGIFDENQSLDAEPFGPTEWSQLIQPWNSMEELYKWATFFGGDVEAYPTCAGSTRNTSCVAAATDAAATKWMNRVRTAGSTRKNPQGADTIPKWLNFPAPDPPNPLPAGYLDNLDNHKIRARLKVEFLAAAGKIDPSSIAAEFEAVTGDAHVPDFIRDFMYGVNTDYGVPLPNLQYDAVDLNRYTHAYTHVDALASGDMPGRSYRWKVSDPVVTDNGTCVRVKTISGGSKGDKPMVKNDALAASVETWKNRVEDQYELGRAPYPVYRLANAIYDEFFRNASLVSPHTPYHYAPAIWIQQDVKACADGSVKPGSSQIAYNGFMPDLYIWVDGQGVGLDGKPKSGPAQLGDYPDFLSPPEYLPPFTNRSPWEPCHTNSADPDFVTFRNGSPWNLQFLTSEDESPDHVRFCDEPVDTLQDPHDG